MEIASQNYSEGGSRRTAVRLSCALWFALGGLVLVVRVARLVRRSSPPCSVGRCFGHLARLCRRSVSLLAGTDSGPVAKELQQRRLVRAHSWIPYGNLVASIVVGTVLIRTTRPSPRFNSSVQDVFLLVGCFTTLFLGACPSVVTLNTLDVWSSFLAVCIAMWVSPFAMEATYAASTALLPFAATMMLSVFNLNVRANLVWLLVLTTSSCGTILFGSEDPLMTGDCGLSLSSLSRVHSATHVLVSGMVLAACVVCFHRYICLAAQYEMEARISRNELQAARSVLRGVCDVVVELDSDFRLQDESPQLVDMLLLNSQRSLFGEDVRSFLASEQDRQKFTEQMGRTWQQSDDVAGLSAAFHVSMKDSSSIPLVVEVFGVRFVNRGAQAAYFVGIREFTDISPILAEGSAAEVRHGALQSRGPPAAVFGAPAVLAEDSSQASSDVTSDALSWDADLPSEAEATGWIDILTAGYTVKHATPAFTQHLEANKEFLAALKPHQRSDFIFWAQQAYVDLLQGASESANRQYGERLHIKSSARAATSGTRPQRTRPTVSAFLRLDLTPPPDGQPHSRGVVRIVLQGLQVSGVPRSLPRGTPRAAAEGQRGAVAGAAAPLRRPGLESL